MMTSEPSTSKKYWALIGGISLSILATLLGYAFSPQETPFPTDPYLLLMPILSSGMSFGYWIGYYFKDRENQIIAKVFFTSSFGSATILELLYLLFTRAKIHYILIQIFSIIVVVSLILSDAIESERLTKLKAVIKIFSEDASYPIIFIFLMNWYFGPLQNIEFITYGGAGFLIYLGIKYVWNQRENY